MTLRECNLDQAEGGEERCDRSWSAGQGTPVQSIPFSEMQIFFASAQPCSDTAQLLKILSKPTMAADPPFITEKLVERVAAGMPCVTTRSIPLSVSHA